MISGQQDFFFSSNLVGRIFFSLSKPLQDIFFLSSFLCRIFFPQKSVVFTFTACSYIYIVVIAVNVFSLWDVNRKDIDLFIEEANTFHPTIKFTAEISEKEITFLDTIVYKGERFLKEANLA